MEYLSDTLQITILKRNLDLQIMEDLMQSSKRHQAPLQLVHAWYLSFPQTMSHLIQFRNGSVDPCCGAFRGSPDCSLLMPAAHPVLWIRGKSSASRLNTSLDKTTSHCYLAAQNFLTLLPS